MDRIKTLRRIAVIGLVIGAAALGAVCCALFGLGVGNFNPLYFLGGAAIVTLVVGPSVLLLYAVGHAIDAVDDIREACPCMNGNMPTGMMGMMGSMGKPSRD